MAFQNHAIEADTPDFSLLQGWSEFQKKKTARISGIRALDDHTLSFEFEKTPDEHRLRRMHHAEKALVIVEERAVVHGR